MAISVSYDPSANRIIVTGGTEGSPATFQDIVNADRAGSFKLLNGIIDADPDVFSLDNQPRPVEKLALQLQITCTPRTGATCNISGKDTWGNNINENGIDISSGSATTTNRFSEIDANGVIVNGLQVGDNFDIDQNQWGVVWDYSGNNTYFLDALLRIGDNYTSTYFKDLDKVIVFTDKISGNAYLFDVYRYATLQLGELIDAGKKETCNGCAIHVVRPSSNYSYLFKSNYNQGTRLLYGCMITSLNVSSKVNYLFCYDTDRFWNCIITNYSWFYCYGDTDFYNVTQMGGSAAIKVWYGIWIADAGAMPTINDTKFMRPNRAIRVYSDAEARNIVAADNDNAVFIGVSNYSYTTKLIDCIIDNWIVYGQISASGEVLRQYTCNVNVRDRNGNIISGATVKVSDKDDNTVFETTTGADGSINEKTITFQRWNNLGSGSHGEDEAYCYSPHKLIISKSGYETLEIDNITVNKALDLKFELLPALDEGDVEKDVSFGEDKIGKFYVPPEDKVVKDTGYGKDGNEFTGTYEGGIILKGENLEGQLQKPDSPEGQLEQRTDLEGVLSKKDVITGETEEKKDFEGELETETNLTGEK